MKVICNPVLKGFHPDPSFIRVGEDYYIVSSTFEWFPGVPIHHSKDLIHWHLVGHILCDRQHLNLTGVCDSGGVWAPSLSWHNGLFYLLYTTVRTCGAGRPFKDTPVYLITSPAILGPWSDPVHLHSSGFDPSLFHDDDDRKWLVNMAWDFRKDHPRFAGITLQEYDHQKRRLVGTPATILRKNELIEGPNLYKHRGYYYLMLAEGGTGWNHGISIARAKSISGPYEVDPQGAVLTARDDASLALQKAGHGELVQTQAGDWYLAHLCSRPVGAKRRCVLGRETAIQKVTWSPEGWLRLEAGGVHPLVKVPAPEELPASPWPEEPERDDFDRTELGPSWNSLRVPVSDQWLSLRERPGWLRLRGRESTFSLFEQSLVARRLTDFHVEVETRLEFEPANFNQMAGLICWYDTRTHYYLRITHHEKFGKVLGVVFTDDGTYDELNSCQIGIDDWKQCYLRASITYDILQFSASPNGENWQSIGEPLDVTRLSDDYGQGLHFTGAFVGLCAQDLNGTGHPADFDYFSYQTSSSGECRLSPRN